MNVSRTFGLSILVLGAVALAACSANSEPAPANTGASAAALTSGEAPGSALAGTWAFALDESEVGSKVHASCDSRANGNAAKAAACYDAIKKEGASEKLRFTLQAGGTILWTSFGQRGDEEELFLEAPLTMTAEGPTRYSGKLAGELRGKQAEEIKKDAPLDHGIPFELVDARTLVMPDPHKGRLVFHKE